MMFWKKSPGGNAAPAAPVGGAACAPAPNELVVSVEAAADDITGGPLPPAETHINNKNTEYSTMINTRSQ